jgi:hypothetical protein
LAVSLALELHKRILYYLIFGLIAPDEPANKPPDRRFQLAVQFGEYLVITLETPQTIVKLGHLLSFLIAN